MNDTFLLDLPEYHGCSGPGRTWHYMAALMVEAGFEVATTSLCFLNPNIPVRVKAIESDIVCYRHPTRNANPTGARRKCCWEDRSANTTFSADHIHEDECFIIYEEEYIYLAALQTICDHEITREDIVYLPYIDPTFCFPGKKTIKSLLYGVGSAHKPVCGVDPDIPGAVIIPNENAAFPDGQRHNPDYVHHRTLGFLRAAENLYTTDHNTSLIIEAHLCGCRVWYVMYDGTVQEKRFGADRAAHETIDPVRDIEIARRFGTRILKFFEGGLTSR